jgi:hypothetical protein
LPPVSTLHWSSSNTSTNKNIKSKVEYVWG